MVNDPRFHLAQCRGHRVEVSKEADGKGQGGETSMLGTFNLHRNTSEEVGEINPLWFNQVS